jgi:hypothetical protein
MDLQEMVYKIQDRDTWQAVVHTAMNLLSFIKQGIS